MKHLNDNQFEDILAGRADEPAHVRECPACREKLAAHGAVRGRLRSAFDNVQAGDELRRRVQSSVKDSLATQQTAVAAPQARRLRLRPLWRPLAAAAVLLLAAIPLAIYLSQPPAATASQEALAEIHRHNMSSHGEKFFTAGDPTALAAYFREKLGFHPAIPHLDEGMALRGCCVRHFRGKIVGSYVVDTPEGVISIVVVTDLPKSLGMQQRVRHGGRTFGAGSFARCNMVTQRMGQYTYCAVGETPPALLADLLSRLVPADASGMPQTSPAASETSQALMRPTAAL